MTPSDPSSSATALPPHPGATDPSRPPADAHFPESEGTVDSGRSTHAPPHSQLQLARLFHSETGTGTFGHLALLGILAVFLWDLIDQQTIALSAGLITFAVFARFAVHRSARALVDDPAALVRRTRIATLLPAGAWGAVSLVVSPMVGPDIWSRYLLVMAGIVAAATATHMADRASYHLLSAFILVPTALGTLLQGSGPNTVFDLMVIIAYAGMMGLIHERAHAQVVRRITTASRLQAATRASTREKEFLDGVLGSIPDAMALIDPHDRITRMNDEFRGIVVPADPDRINVSLADLAGSGLGTVLAQAVKRARSDGLSERECRTSAGGETRWFVATAARASGHAEGWVFLQLRDITSLRSAQKAQQKAEADLADMVESANDLIWRVDARGRWTFLNSAAEAIYGVSRDELLGTNALDLSPEDRREHDRETLQQILAGGAMVNHLTVHRRSDGEERWMSFSGSPLRDDTEAVVGAHGIARDVTAEVQAREALEQLAERNSLVRSLINASDDLVFYKDTNSVYRGSNHAFVDLLAIPVNELVGRTDHDLFPKELADANRARDLEVMNTRSATSYEVHYDANEPYRVWETVETAYVSDDGELLGVLGISREMTEWKQAQERIQRMAEEAERAANMKSAFLANMSHEIRTPMNGVLGMSELLQDTEMDGEQRQYVDVIRSSAENLLRILNDILDFSKIEAGHLQLDDTVFDLHKEIGDAVRAIAIQASRRGNELLVDLAPDLPQWVEGDPGRLRQIITNLVGNAVKFTQEGEVEVGAALVEGSDDESAHIRIWVRDSGIGIAEDKLTLIFKEFSQADASVSRRYGGTGLGLAISRRLVSLMGGTMQLESKEGEGSTFTFDVVLSPCDPPAGSRRVADTGPVDLSSMSILVVDDNQTNRRILRGVLGEAGAATHLVESGAEALHRLDELDESGAPPDLIIMDVQMPELDGLEVIERLRTYDEYARFRQIPILVLTSANRSDDTRRVRELGVEGYFLKPLPRPDLLRAVAAIESDRSQSAPRSAQGRGTTVGSESLRHHRVLVVEDNPVNRLVACATLEKAGYKVEVATNGVEAVAAVKDDEFQLVLMDIQMPEMDGLEATRVIREMEAEQDGRPLPIIALTAHALEEERERCLNAGMNDFLAKPFRAEDLLGLLEHWARIDDSDEDASMETHSPLSDTMTEDPTPSAAVPDEPPVDVAGFRATLEAAGIGEVFDITMNVFKGDLPNRTEAIHEAWKAGEAQKIADAAHAIKSAAGNVQANRLAELVNELELAGRDDDRPRMEAVWPQVAAELVRVESFLREL